MESNQSTRAFGSNTKKKSTNPRKNMGDVKICEGTTDQMSEAWTRVKSEEDVRDFYTTFFPAYPEQLIAAIVYRMSEKLQQVKSGNGTPDDMYTGSVRKADPNKWDYKTDVEKQKAQARLAQAFKSLEELQVK